MDLDVNGIDWSSPIGIALIVIGAFLALRVARVVLKLVMVAVVVVGLVVWLGL